MKISSSYKLLLLFVFIVPVYYAQYFEFTWSDKVDYSNNKSGFFAGFIDANDTYVYALNTNIAVNELNKNAKLKLIAYSRGTMSEMASVALLGFPENKATKAEYEELKYAKTVLTEDRVLVFWTKLINTDSTKTEELYVESFKLDLERDKKAKLIFTDVQHVGEKQSMFTPSIYTIVGNVERDQVVIGNEKVDEKGKVVFNYKLLNSDLRLTPVEKIQLAQLELKQVNSEVSNYELGKDGNIYIRTTITLTREQRKLLPPNAAKTFTTLTVVNPQTKATIKLELRGENKTITDFSYFISGTKTRVYGFFGDLSKDPTGIDKQGIFFTEIDSDTLKNMELSYSYFEKTTLNKLFPKSKGGRKKKSEAQQTSKEEELNTRFDIERIFILEDDSAVLFFTRKYNYSEITSKSNSNGENEYRTDYYCEKNNVSAIRISEKGKIAWTSTLERCMTYEGTDIPDLKVIYKLGKFYAIYGTEIVTETQIGSKKEISELRNNVDYASFDPVTGRYKKFNLLLNEELTSKKDLKSINTKDIAVFNSNFYFQHMEVKQKWAWSVANVLWVPTIYYSVLSGNTKHATGDLGVLCLMEGKPNKKKAGKK